MTDAISVAGLVKTFGPTRALDGLDLAVRTGEVHGFLGPNGAGKSTTVRILLGMMRADSGTARLLGSDPWADATALHRRLAYVPGDVTLWPNLSGGEVIDLLGRMRGGLDKWWPAAVTAGVTAVLAQAAVVLSARRDVGAGLLPPRLGRPSAAPSLRSPLALAWRLHRALLAGWIAGFVALGVVLGYLAGGGASATWWATTAR